MDWNSRKKVNDTEEYTIERILEHKEVSSSGCKTPFNDHIWYLIKWVGYSDEDNTYNAAYEFSSLSDLVEYWKIISSRRFLTDIEKDIMQAIVIQRELEADLRYHIPDQRMFKYIKMNHWKFLGKTAVCSSGVTVNSAFSYTEYIREYHHLLCRITSSQSQYPIVEIVVSAQSLEDADFASLPDVHLLEIGPHGVEDSTLVADNAISLKRRFQYGRLLLKRYDYHWALFARTTFEKDSIILKVGGSLHKTSSEYVSEVREYQNSFGALARMKAFVNLGENILDRRHKLDFSIFIAHSCDPNTAIVLRVNDKGGFVPVLMALKRIEMDEQLTIQYNANEPFAPSCRSFETAQAKHIKMMSVVPFQSHIFCSCEEKGCRFIFGTDDYRDKPTRRNSRKRRWKRKS